MSKVFSTNMTVVGDGRRINCYSSPAPSIPPPQPTYAQLHVVYSNPSMPPSPLHHPGDIFSWIDLTSYNPLAPSGSCIARGLHALHPLCNSMTLLVFNSCDQR